MSAETARAFLQRFGVPIAQGFGIIEAGLPLVNTDAAADKPLSIGRPDDVEVWLRGENAPGDLGELCLRGPGIFDAYLVPWQEREDVLRDGWFATGDLATRDEDGHLFLQGRSKSVINVGGMKVFPEEIEAVLNTHPAVRESRVFGEAHARWEMMPSRANRPAGGGSPARECRPAAALPRAAGHLQSARALRIRLRVAAHGEREIAPMNPDEAARIARIRVSFRTPWLRGYVHGKLRSDPAYGAVGNESGASALPLLDIGCGLGLLAFYLREHGYTAPILGLDVDSAKIARGAKVAQRHYPAVTLQQGDALALPLFSGHVCLLDVLHYCPAATQSALLEAVVQRVAPGGWCLIRTTPRDGSGASA